MIQSFHNVVVGSCLKLSAIFLCPARRQLLPRGFVGERGICYICTKQATAMDNNELREASISDIVSQADISHLGDDLMLFDDLSVLPLPCGAVRTGCVIVALCLQGRSRFKANTLDYEVRGGDVLIIPEGQVVDDYVISPDVKAVGLVMSPAFMHGVVSGVRGLSSLILFSWSNPVFTLTDTEVDNMKMYFRLLKAKIADTGNLMRADVVRHIVSAMACELANAVLRLSGDDGRRTRRDEIFAEFIRLVERNYKHERRVAWYGVQMCITPKYLSETVKTVSRRTPNEWIDYYVVMELKVLLRNTTMSIKEIANEMNFSNQSFLGKYFKEHVGVSPAVYRRG